MKNLINPTLYSNNKNFIVQLLNDIKNYAAVIFFLLISIGVFTGCEKQDMKPVDELHGSQAKNTEGNAVNNYTGLSWQTTWELKQARASTAKYQNFDNAIKDGYENIAVDVEGMGHHFMNMKLVDGTFDVKSPEILVYNKNNEGKMELVAVEYAVLLTDPKPEGFTGSGDVWNGESGFPLWLLHAWVWAYNPEGVFNWTNPAVHLH